MALQNFVSKVGPAISATWLNTVDVLKFTVFADSATKAQARTALTSDLPLEIANGGTASRTAAAALTALNGVDATVLLAGASALVGSTGLDYVRTTAEQAAGVTPLNLSIPNTTANNIIYPLRYFIAPMTDMTLALQSAFAVAAQLPRSKVVISDAINVDSTAGILPFAVPSHCQVMGLGEDATQITVTGSTVVTSVFDCANKSGVVFSDFTLIGNSQANAYANGAAISWTNSGSSVIRGFKVKDCTFQNFKGDYWVYAQNNGTAAMKDAAVIGCTFISLTGNARQPTGLGADSSCIGFAGSNSSLAGVIDGITILGNEGHCDYIKSLAVCYQSTKNIKIANNGAINCGLNEVTDDHGAYAIMLYDSAAFQPPTKFALTGNVIDTPRSCGFYLAVANNGTISGNTITGQTDQQETTLPKGGIVCNGTYRLTIGNNTVTDCYRGISLASGQTDMKLVGNKLDSVTNSAMAIKINAGAGAQIRLRISNNTAYLPGTSTVGIQLQTVTGGGNLCDQITMEGNDLDTTSYCIQHRSDDASYNAQNVRIKGNVLKSAVQLISWTNTTKPVTISANNCSGNPSADGIDITGSTKVCVTNNEMEDFTTAYAFKTNGAQGEFWGNHFVRGNANIDPGGGGEILGLVIPTWTGAVGGKVQTAYSGEGTQVIGGTNVKYLTMGWLNSGSGWLPMRTPDGN